MSPRFGLPSLMNDWPSMFTDAGQSYSPLSENPSATAAAVEVTLNVDPGGYSPWVAQLITGSPEAVPNR
jgi:hypothetical protein